MTQKSLKKADNNVARFARLFAGYSKAYGRYELPPIASEGKQKGKATTIESPLTSELYQQHLAGGVAGLGIIPIAEEDLCNFGVIDIDIYPLDHAALEEKISREGLPLVVCYSKSGGAHLYVFLLEPVPAELLVQKLNRWREALGYPKVEVFPKQTRREEGKLGNWINLPYFDAANTNRHAIKNGKSLFLKEFLDYAEMKRITRQQLEEIEVPEVMGCLFMQHCRDNAEEVPYDLWFGLSTVTSARGEEELFHKLSALDPIRYDERKADTQLQYSGKKDAPHKCSTLAEKGFRCPNMDDNGVCKTYKVRSPAAIGKKRNAAENNDSWPAPQNFLELKKKAVPPFPLDFLPGNYGEVVRDVADRMQAAADYAGIPMLVAVSSRIGNSVQLQPKQHDTNWAESPALWGVAIGPSGDKKTPPAGEVLRPLWYMQAAAEAIWHDDMKTYEEELDAWKAAEPGEREEKPERPPRPVVILNEATVEALALCMQGNPAGFMYYRDELAALFLSFNKYRDGDDRQFFLEAWNGGNYKSERKGPGGSGQGSISITDMFLAIYGTTQPEVAEKVFRGTADGLPARFGLAAYPDSRDFRFVDREPNQNAQNAIAEAWRVLKLKFATDDGKPIRLKFNAAGRKTWAEWSEQLHAEIKTRVW